MNTILVTGGAGFIGGCFVRQCMAETNWRVVNFDKLTYAGNLDSLRSAKNHPRYRFVRGDIAEQGEQRQQPTNRVIWATAAPATNFIN